MRLLLSAVVLLALAGCDSLPGARPTFEIIGPELEPEETEYGVTFVHTGTVRLVEGDPEGVYLVYYGIEVLSGGDPENPWPDWYYTNSLVRDGEGPLRISEGYRSNDENWGARQLRLHYLGHQELRQ